MDSIKRYIKIGFHIAIVAVITFLFFKVLLLHPMLVVGNIGLIVIYMIYNMREHLYRVIPLYNTFPRKKFQHAYGRVKDGGWDINLNQICEVKQALDCMMTCPIDEEDIEKVILALHKEGYLELEGKHGDYE